MSVRPVDLLRQLARSLEATPSELAGLVLLCLGGTVLTAVLWLRGPTVGIGLPAPAPAGMATLAPARLTVHVAGAVATPGVVELDAGKRVADAVAAAGGATLLADLDELNLARVLEDGERILVPERGVGGAANGASQGATEGTTEGTTQGARRADGRLDINRATAAELEELPGIGPALAGRIIAWREQHGPFRETSQLREVSGIGERTFQGLADLVVV